MRRILEADEEILMLTLILWLAVLALSRKGSYFRKDARTGIPVL
jgi:hypothetical protein